MRNYHEGTTAEVEYYNTSVLDSSYTNEESNRMSSNLNTPTVDVSKHMILVKKDLLHIYGKTLLLCTLIECRLMFKNLRIQSGCTKINYFKCK